MNKLNKLINQYCPNGVEFKTLGNCCQILDNKRKPITRSAREPGPYPYYGANGIQDYVSGYIFDGTFVLVGEDGSVITEHGNPVVNWAEGKIWVNNHAHIITSVDGIMLRYLYHYLQTVNIKPLIHGNIPKLTGGDFKSIQIPVPPIPVQEEIVRILDKFTELEAELAQELAHRKQQYAFYRDKLLDFNKQMVSMRPLLDVASVLYGYPCDATKFNTTTNGRPLIRIRDIVDGITQTYTTEEIPDAYVIHNGDLLIGMDGNFHVGSWRSSDAILCQRVCCIKSLDEKMVLNRYLHHFLPSVIKRIENGKPSGTVKHLLAKDIQAITVPVPSLDIQKRLVYVLDNLDSICSDLSIGLPAEIAAREKQYNYYRDLLFNYAADMAGFKQSRAEQSRAEQSRAEQSRVDEIKLIQYVFGCIGLKVVDIASVTIGEFVHKNQQNENGKYPVYNGGVVNTGYYDHYNQTKNKIIISARGANAGFVNRVTSHFWAGNSCYSVSANDDIVDWNYLYYYLKNKEKELLGKQQKGGIPAISKSQVKEFNIQLPTIEEQRKIVNILDRFDKLCNGISDGLPAEINKRQLQYEWYRTELFNLITKGTKI